MDPKLIEQMLNVTNSPYQEQYALYIEHEDDSSDDEDDYDDGYSQNLGSRYNAKKFVKPSFDINQMMTIIIEKNKNLEREKLERDKEKKLLKQMLYQKDTQITKCNNDLTKKNEEIKCLKLSNKEKDIKLKEKDIKLKEKDIKLKEQDIKLKEFKCKMEQLEIKKQKDTVDPDIVDPNIAEPLELKSQITEREHIPDASNIAIDLSHDPDDFNYMPSNNGYYNTTDDEQDDNQIDADDYGIFDEKDDEEIKDDNNNDNDNDDNDDDDDTNDNNDESEVLLPRIIMRDITPRQYNHYGKDDTMRSDAGYRYYHEIILPQRINRLEQNLQEMQTSNTITNIDPNIFASFVLSLLNTFKLKQTYEIFIVYLLCKSLIK